MVDMQHCKILPVLHLCSTSIPV